MTSLVSLLWSTSHDGLRVLSSTHPMHPEDALRLANLLSATTRGELAISKSDMQVQEASEGKSASGPVAFEVFYGP